MATDIEKMAVFDDRIIQTRPKYAVEKGALSLTNQPFQAIAANQSQHTYQISVPSENVFVDRAVEWTALCALQATITIPAGTPVGEPVLVFGRDVALAPFPLHTLTQTLTATINDTTTTMNTSDVLREVLRLTDYKKNRLQRTCPTMLDTYASYNDAFGAVNNPLGDYASATTREEVPNGAYFDVQFTTPAGGTLIGAANYTYTPTGQITNVVNGVPVATINPATGAIYTSYPIFITFRSTEKLVLSPFVFSDIHEYDTGLFGIQNIQLVMNMLSPSLTGVAGRVLRFCAGAGRGVATAAPALIVPYGYNSNITGGTPYPQGSAVVNVQFLTPSLDIPLPPKSVVPYMEFPRFISNITTSGTIAPQQLATGVQSQTITLPTIPDLFIIYAKPNAYSLTDGDYYLPIEQISVNFDNFAGLLSSHSVQQLYGMSVKNGLDMDYNSWRGSGKVASAAGQQVPLVGGFLVLKPSQDITLQSGQAPSLVGNFTFQFNCSVRNTTNTPLTGFTLYVITANSGFFESIKGSSRVIKGVLSEQDIITAPLAPAGTRASLHRLVGSGVFDNLANVLSKAKDIAGKVMPVARAVAPLVKPMLPDAVQQGMSAVGLGRRGRKDLSARLM